MQLGDFNESDPRYKLRQIRVGLQVPNNGVRYTAMLTVPGGQEIGPIDIPFRFNVELPVNISFSTDIAAAENQQIMCTAHDLPDSPDILGATYYLDDAIQPPDRVNPLGFLMQIPQWVQAVTVYNGSTAKFLDSGGSDLCTFTGPLMVARPRKAVYITATGSTVNPVLFHY
jgi:hypothetical protein